MATHLAGPLPATASPGRAYSEPVRVLGLSSRVAALAVLVGASLGLLYVWGPWRGKPDPCTTLDDGVRACMPIVVVPPPLWAYFAFACGGALVALILTAAAGDVHRRVGSH